MAAESSGMRAQLLLFAMMAGTAMAQQTGGGGVPGTAGGGSSSSTTALLVASEESVASSATPTFSTAYRESTTVLTANITSFTLAAGTAGQEKTLTFCQNATGGYSVTPPSNVRGFFTVGTTLSKCSSQHFTYNSTQTAWLADSPGVINQ
jgi:hypothetical protein